MQVPLLDLKAQYASLEAELDSALKDVCRSGQFALGPRVEEFERRWADYCEARFCVAVSSGTAALHLALLATGVGPGDEVITTPMSFFATAEAIVYTGARPVFVDVDPATGCLDPAGIEAALTERTRAILPVHLFGHPADMDPILDLARRRRLAVIEDACQAHGALYKGRKVGAIGEAGAFSFYPTKNLSAFGEAGALVTNEPEIDARARMLRNHGQNARYRHSAIGHNYRMDAIQGAVLNVKLDYLDTWNGRRRAIASSYSEAFAGLPVRPIAEPPYGRSAWHVYAVRCEERDALAAHLTRAGIATAIHYPVPMSDQQALAGLLGTAPYLPEAARMASEVLSLPLYAELTDAQVEAVIAAVRGFYSRTG